MRAQLVTFVAFVIINFSRFCMHNSRRVHNGTNILWLKLFALYAACAGFPGADLYGEFDPGYEFCHVFGDWIVTRS